MNSPTGRKPGYFEIASWCKHTWCRFYKREGGVREQWQLNQAEIPHMDEQKPLDTVLLTQVWPHSSKL